MRKPTSLHNIFFLMKIEFEKMRNNLKKSEEQPIAKVTLQDTVYFFAAFQSAKKSRKEHN